MFVFRKDEALKMMKKSCTDYKMASVNVTSNENGDLMLTKSRVKKIPLSTQDEQIWYELEPTFRYFSAVVQISKLILESITENSK